MTIFDALILGLTQGITEFFPVSSSGHLLLVQHFLGMQDLDHYVLFDLVCHLGTLLAIILVFCNQIIDTLFRSSARLKQVILGTLPLLPVVLVIGPIKTMYSNLPYLGFFFLATSAILFLGIHWGKRASIKTSDAFIIGIWQAIAILPGISRSGSTISGARLLGWSSAEAVTFSFLIAIPAILGGTALELIKLRQYPDAFAALPLSCYLTAFFFSFSIGYCALLLLIRMATHEKFSYFAWYCLLLGLATTYYFYL